ncbi:1-acyl-sn-glycerol-3-phosphate acyltransferase [Tamaricihabitans halophyticus]|uniref:1-acyl-sn-glycerol-3-phosphate acyltransferase n=1 Tax=Tamaricihabitans halophyticus TaxID=1262583 RepID=A0A4V2SR15_9PSEU|nr:lysophospholipid acyltransferase family protein [Tamaricihabitans halophyticus]TCP41106.1 1-acyl-sn-glycerol-3-phosphate acyltransferase [Tamaricihabitans halophyticus]
MVARDYDSTEPTRRSPHISDVPQVWRALTAIDSALVRLVGKLEVTGTFPDELRGRPVLVAANHIGMFDPFVLIAACRALGVAPRFMLTAGLLDAPVLGRLLRASGHIRVDRGKSNVAEAFGRATNALRDARVPLLVYPEGRISREPGLWPERGKTGLARMALHGDVPVITISQWGAHEAMYWGTPTVRGWQDLKPLVTSFAKALAGQRRFRVHFGEPVDLGDLSADRVGDAMRAHTRIMRAITANLVPLRAAEPDTPRFHDPTRPTDSHSPWRPES